MIIYSSTKDISFDWHKSLCIKKFEDDETIDYKNKKRFIEVYIGQALLRKEIKSKVNKVELEIEYEVKCGENIRIEHTGNDITEYFASTNGILDLESDQLEIKTSLIVNQDVDLTTGNIVFGRDIIINGDIREGFNITCGGDLTINGSIENSVKILCKGNMKVTSIYGENSFVRVMNKLELKFIHGARIQAYDIVIRSYSHHATVFAYNSIIIEGDGVHSQKGAIIGGILNSFKTMKLSSLGSEKSSTKLALGVNLNILDKVNLIHEKVLGLKKKIRDLNEEVDLASGFDNARQKFHNMNEENKVSYKVKLSLLKKTILIHNAISCKESELLEKQYFKDPSLLKIEVESAIIPDIHLRVLNKSFMIKKMMNHKCITYSNDEIKFN